MAYAVEFSPGAEREFRKLAREIQLRLRPALYFPLPLTLLTGRSPHLHFSLGAGVTPAEGSVKPTVGFTFNDHPLPQRPVNFGSRRCKNACSPS